MNLTGCTGTFPVRRPVFNFIPFMRFMVKQAVYLCAQAIHAVAG